ncbi:MAG TPA: hypothetical protein VN605_07615 [Thermoanaerobaculia bacterium]|nr:hypothetical protein [Thermoanaerobaculia bacterium]
MRPRGRWFVGAKLIILLLLIASMALPLATCRKSPPRAPAEEFVTTLESPFVLYYIWPVPLLLFRALFRTRLGRLTIAWLELIAAAAAYVFITFTVTVFAGISFGLVNMGRGYWITTSLYLAYGIAAVWDLSAAWRLPKIG